MSKTKRFIQTETAGFLKKKFPHLKMYSIPPKTKDILHKVNVVNMIIMIITKVYIFNISRTKIPCSREWTCRYTPPAPPLHPKVVSFFFLKYLQKKFSDFLKYFQRQSFFNHDSETLTYIS